MTSRRNYVQNEPATATRACQSLPCSAASSHWRPSIPAASSVLSHMSRDGEVASGVLTPSEVRPWPALPMYSSVSTMSSPTSAPTRCPVALRRRLRRSTIPPRRHRSRRSGYDWSLLSYVRALDPTLNEPGTPLAVNRYPLEVAVIQLLNDTAAPVLGNGKVIFRNNYPPPHTTVACQTPHSTATATGRASPRFSPRLRPRSLRVFVALPRRPV